MYSSVSSEFTVLKHVKVRGFLVCAKYPIFSHWSIFQNIWCVKEGRIVENHPLTL